MEADDATGLDSRHRLVAAELGLYCSDAEAAAAIGRDASWVPREKRKNPAFAQLIEEVRAARVEQVTAALGGLLEQATAAVERNLQETHRPADQLRAAQLVYDRFRLFRDDAAREAVFRVRAELAELRAEVHQLRNDGEVREP